MALLDDKTSHLLARRRDFRSFAGARVEAYPGRFDPHAAGTRPGTWDPFQHFSEHCRDTADGFAWLIERSGLRILEQSTQKGGTRVLLAAAKEVHG